MQDVRSPKRLELWIASLPIEDGSHVQGGERPVLIVSNDLNNTFAETVNVLPLTGKLKRPGFQPHTAFPPDEASGLKRDSTVLAEQITTLDKWRLVRRLGSCTDPALVARIETSMGLQLGLGQDRGTEKEIEGGNLK